MQDQMTADTAGLKHFDKLKADITLKLSPYLAIEVADEATMQSALTAGKEAKDFRKMIEEKRKELVKPHNQRVDQINAYAKEILAPVTEAESHLKSQLIAYEKVKEQERRVEQQRLDQERQKKEADLAAKAKAEKERLEMEAAFGMTDPASQKRNELVVKAEVSREQAELEIQARADKKAVASNKVSGIRKVWTFEIEDESKIPRQFLIVDETKIRAAVRADIREIAGVRIFEKTEIALR